MAFRSNQALLDVGFSLRTVGRNLPDDRTSQVGVSKLNRILCTRSASIDPLDQRIFSTLNLPPAGGSTVLFVS